MSNGAGRCCLLQICCRRSKSVTAWKKVFVKAGLSPTNADKAAEATAGEIEAMGDLEEAVKAEKAAHPQPEA